MIKVTVRQAMPKTTISAQGSDFFAVLRDDCLYLLDGSDESGELCLIFPDKDIPILISILEKAKEVYANYNVGRSR